MFYLFAKMWDVTGQRGVICLLMMNERPVLSDDTGVETPPPPLPPLLLLVDSELSSRRIFPINPSVDSSAWETSG